jgi:hypothetical protein
VKVTATNTAGTSSASSAVTATVVAGPPPSEQPATETPTYVAGPMPDTPDPDPVEPLSLLSRGKYSLLQLEPLSVTSTVTWSSSSASFKFGNGDGIWEISKNCRDWTDAAGRHAVGPGYIFRTKAYFTGLQSLPTRSIVDDTVAVTPGREKFGLMNAVYGGLGSFGFHYARGPVGNTPAGDDPTTEAVETATGRFPQKVIEGRQCANTNDGYGVYARSWTTPRRINSGRVDFEITVWFKDQYGNTGAGPGGDALVRVRYRYSFLRNQVRSWNSVRVYAITNASGTPFVKEPKFAAVANGGGYTRVAVFQNSRYVTGTMRGAPDDTAIPLNTAHSAWNARTTVQWDYAFSAPKPTGSNLPSAVNPRCDSSKPCLTVTAKAMPVDRQGDVKAGAPSAAWERTRGGLGLDGWATRPEQDPDPPPIPPWSYPRDTSGDGVVSGCSATLRGVRTGNDTVRRWEIGGFKSSGSGDSNTSGYERAFASSTAGKVAAGPRTANHSRSRCPMLQALRSRRTAHTWSTASTEAVTASDTRVVIARDA